MQTIFRVLAFAALALTVVPPFLFMIQQLAEPTMKSWMLAGTVLWFATAPWALRGGAR
ncbi:hypothetical protein G4L39_01245 [Limisphaera ngatamarikiensis]|jgi:hypothetical protein|uniref:Uncharacterized protein n=1 Tax=Limisphaera ngatamarikiensis TaxID=1324935 RepID=A0A6M1RRE0_9BACT|nr:hypothetical protein [Limisphaera ngatamarikiensis]NGO38024.1 hypothetical protein [Limisphaera ngatamarikiensis]